MAVMIDCTTDNNNRTVGNIRSYFNKADGNLGVNGSVEFIFTRYCLFKIKNNNIDLDNLELELIDYGLEEIIMDESSNEILIYGNYDSFGLIQTEIEKRNIDIISSDFERIPNNYKNLEYNQKNDLEKWLFFIPLELIIEHFWNHLSEWLCTAIIPFCKELVKVKS